VLLRASDHNEHDRFSSLSLFLFFANVSITYMTRRFQTNLLIEPVICLGGHSGASAKTDFIYASSFRGVND
jgi:hypothetical protein